MKWLAGLLLLSTITPAWGEAVFSDITPKQMRDVLSHAGLPAELEMAPEGPQISSRLEKHAFNVFFFGCTGAPETHCREVQFYTGFLIEGMFPTAQINSWNGAHRFGRAYIDQDGNAALEMDVDAVGTSETQLSDAVLWWKTLVPQFADFLKKAISPQIGPSAQGTPSTSAY
ncbi:MAG: YbjN domain-containing protein [Alphaproteobacteria bacterium]